MQEARNHSLKIKQEAEELLKATYLQKLLEEYGEVNLGGSFAYNLMVDRDLDFGVAVKEITPEIRAKIASTFTSQSWAYGINMTDRVNFEPLSNLGAPRGLYLGLTIPFPKERWNIDVWFTVGNDLPEDKIGQMISSATQNQKDTMLQIKYELMRNGKKEKGITSAEVYTAVLNEDIQTTEQFLHK
ncbi:MAG: hypothetical protein M3Q79_03050 [bacterium]|nr:hypothetical protein [bacterium]